MYCNFSNQILKKKNKIIVWPTIILQQMQHWFVESRMKSSLFFCYSSSFLRITCPYSIWKSELKILPTASTVCQKKFGSAGSSIKDIMLVFSTFHSLFQHIKLWYGILYTTLEDWQWQLKTDHYVKFSQPMFVCMHASMSDGWACIFIAASSYLTFSVHVTEKRRKSGIHYKICTRTLQLNTKSNYFWSILPPHYLLGISPLLLPQMSFIIRPTWWQERMLRSVLLT